MAVELTTSHALLSASSAARWLNCLPSAKLNAELPDTTNEYAEKGTLAHALAELKLRKYSTVMTNRKYVTVKQKGANPGKEESAS